MSSTPPPGFPVDNPITSYWLKDSHPLASYRSSDTVPEQCDIAIIGTGMAGVATAYHILSDPNLGEKKPTVVLLEARQACSGATGRNGGHTKLATSLAQHLMVTHGATATEEASQHQLDQLVALRDVVKKEKIDCDLVDTRSFDVYFDENLARESQDFLHAQQAQGASWVKEVQWVQDSELDKVTGTKNSKGALIVPAISFWPYKLVTGLLDRVLERGGKLYTNTCVLKAEETSRQTILTTTRGILKADKAVFATNAYTAALLPQYEAIITPVKGQNSHLSPAPIFAPPEPLKNTYNLRFTEGPDYLVPRPDGTIILGGAKWTFERDRQKWWNNVDDTTLINDEATAHFDSVMANNFLGWEGAKAHHDMVWTGIMGVTPDMLPHVGRVPGSKNQWLLAGFNGAGMLLIFTMAQAIAKMVANGVEYEDTGLSGIFKSTPERLNAE